MIVIQASLFGILDDLKQLVQKGPPPIYSTTRFSYGTIFCRSDKKHLTGQE